ncbi:MAG: hypothetical protein AAF413_03665, partial [Patescibacteria group bacterium]
MLIAMSGVDRETLAGNLDSFARSSIEGCIAFNGVMQWLFHNSTTSDEYLSERSKLISELMRGATTDCYIEGETATEVRKSSFLGASMLSVISDMMNNLSNRLVSLEASDLCIAAGNEVFVGLTDCSKEEPTIVPADLEWQRRDTGGNYLVGIGPILAVHIATGGRNPRLTPAIEPLLCVQNPVLSADLASVYSGGQDESDSIAAMAGV